MLIDDVEVRLQGGRGGDGVVGFNKIPMHLGPTGANGGRGGDIYFVGVSDLSALQQFQFKKEIRGKNGGAGDKALRDGPAGEDIELKVPAGTVIHDLEGESAREITHVGERMLAAKGGTGGRGNYTFRGPHNTSPYESTQGKQGRAHRYRLELKMIADVGFIGLPNAGKSSLLNALTNAAAKVGNYAFTTLEPNLGAYYDLILADIPGLIEGASGGKGLGTKFLRHVERTRTLFHLISAESDDPARDYGIVRNELKQHSPALLEKPEHVLLTKVDLFGAEDIAQKLAALNAVLPSTETAQAISVLNTESFQRVKNLLTQVSKGKSNVQ